MIPHTLALAEPTVVLGLAPDDPAERMVTLVVQAGAKPVAVSSDADGLATVVAGAAPDVVLVDLALAPAGGAWLTALAAASPGVPLVALCSDESPGTLATALAAGVVGFVSRGAGACEIGGAIEAARAGERAVAPDLLGPLLDGVVGRLRTPGPATGDRQSRRAALLATFSDPSAVFPVFQPIADLRVGRQFGWLALTRFSDSPPEQTGVRFAEARALGLTVELETAAARAALAGLDRLPGPAPLFLKASCATVAAEVFDELLPEELAARVVLELWGVAELEDPESFNHAVDRLRHRGVRFAVDETGAGFGSLDQVLDLSPAFVRLAGGLTRGIDADRTRRALALTVISFASHLGAGVIGDQIETAEELAALRRLGVDYGLGFHIGRPLSLPALPAGIATGLDTLQPAGDPDPDGPVRWSRSEPARRLELPGRAHASFDAAVTAVLRLLAQRLPGATPYVALLDSGAGLRHVVDAEGDSPPLQAGATSPLDASLDGRVLAGTLAQSGSSAGLPDSPGCSHWAVMPFAGDPERPLATLSMVAETAAFGDEAVELLHDAAGTLAAALEREHGADAERVAAALRDLAGRDRFTGLLNAHRFREVLNEANARAIARGALTHVTAVSVCDLDGLPSRFGQTVGGLVLKDVARSLALEADHLDALARVGPTTFGCVLFGRSASEVEYFCRSVTDRVAASGRRRGATVELRTGLERLGLRAVGDDAWQSAIERMFAT